MKQKQQNLKNFITNHIELLKQIDSLFVAGIPMAT